MFAGAWLPETALAQSRRTFNPGTDRPRKCLQGPSLVNPGLPVTRINSGMRQCLINGDGGDSGERVILNMMPDACWS